MINKRLIAIRDESCLKCNFCFNYVACPGSKTGCIGCGACIKGCPQGAIHLKPRTDSGTEIRFTLDGKPHTAKSPVSVLEALRALGRITDTDTQAHDGKDSIQAFCDTGGCWNCAVLIDGVLVRSCVTTLIDGMEIVTDPEITKCAEPKRIVTLMRPPPHFHPSVFTHGCNYSCDLCHNWDMTFSSTRPILNAAETVEGLKLDIEQDYWVGISGGEPTLNRSWLLETIRKLRQAAPDIRIQLDTNASLLTPDYIDELINVGITDISPDLKAGRPDTFMKVCGISSEKIARLYLETSWKAVRYINDTYSDQVFMAVSVPCHPRTHSMDELKEIARAIASINPEIAVTLIEYQPAFRLRDWPGVSPNSMEQVQKILESEGLCKVIVQGGLEIPRAVDPMNLSLCSEEF